MNQRIEDKNKELVLKAFDTLFNKRDNIQGGRPIHDRRTPPQLLRRRRI